MNTQNKILIVDDDVDLCNMLEYYFNNLGYEAHVARRGAEAIRIARDARPDVILLDVELPDSDGYTVANALRADRYTEHIPIVFLTAHGEREERLTALELGAADFIDKPFDAQELRLRVERLVKRGR